MKDKKLNIDLSSLYKEPLIGGFNKLDNNPELFEWLNKYSEEQDELTKFMNTCSLENFVYLFVVAFKFKYPNFVSLQSTFHNIPIEETLEEQVFESGFDRGDISELVVHTFMGPIEDEYDPGNRKSYEQKIGITFNEKIPSQAIKDALDECEYEKNKEGDSTIYTITDSPIAKLIVKEKGLEIEINEDKVYLYYVS